MEDTEIIELYWQRSQQAITETDGKYGRQLYNLSQKILYNQEDSEECVNDTYHAAWNTIPPKKPEFFFAYLAKIARNFCFGKLDYQKAKKRDALIVELSTELENCISAPDDYTRKMESEEIGRIISGFLRTQTEQMRKVFVRRYWYMDSITDIAKAYNMSDSKVKSILFRMRGKLREHLEEEGIVL